MNRWVRLLMWVVARGPAWCDSHLPRALGRRLWLRARHTALELYPRRFTRTINPEGIVFVGNTRDVIQRSIMLHSIWEPDITQWMRSFVGPGDVVADIGANVGYYSLLLSRLVGPQGRVVAAEPVPSIQAELRERLAANSVGNVEVLDVALGPRSGRTEVFRASADNIGNSSTIAETGHTSEGQVCVRSADEVLLELAPALKFVKIDTEGDEYRVLSGMRQTLAFMPPGSAVLVEITPEKLANRGHAPAAIWQVFDEATWRALRIRNDYDFAGYTRRVVPLLVEIDRPPDDRCDLVFVKR